MGAMGLLNKYSTPIDPFPRGITSMRHRLRVRFQPTSARFRFGWLAVVWVVVFGPLAAFGAYYAVAGNPAPGASDGPYVVLEKNMFYGLHGHGVIQLCIAFLLLYCLGPTLWGYPERERALMRVLLLAGSYSGLTAIAFLCAPLAGGVEGLGCVWWIVGCLVSYGAVVVVPPSYHEVARDRERVARLRRSD